MHDIPEDIALHMQGMLYELVISITADNSLEFRLGWYDVAVLTMLTDGILYNPQEEAYFTKPTVLAAAERIVNEFEHCLESEDWRLHRFTSWNNAGLD